ncbi:bifunctional hydroxymethylpyrimidine kinase/phosphomethylpyrimidine kinase [Corynebacterium diphtheriae]
MVCDPVLRAGGGGSLGKDEVGYAMRERLLPLSLIATPNLPEAPHPRRTAQRHGG